MKSGRKDFPM